MSDQSSDQPTDPSSGTPGWRELLSGTSGIYMALLCSGVLIHAMNTLLMSTVLPSALADVGGLEFMSWTTTIYMVASVIASSGGARVKAALDARRAYALAALLFCAGTILCGLAGSMTALILGRLVQGLGGGLLAALGYAMVRNLFAEIFWPRVFASLSAVWGVAALAGPSIGGAFASLDFWRGAFFSIAAIAALLAAASMLTFPRQAESEPMARQNYPALRLGLIGAAILAASLASIAARPGEQLALLAASAAALIILMRLDRTASTPLFPSDAFSLASSVGLGLWMILMLSIANDSFTLFGPLLLQNLHGLDPLTAGYLVAWEAMSWTLMALVVASLPARWSPVFLIAGPIVMGAGLLGIGQTLPQGPLSLLVLAVFCAGGGIGICWSFISHRIMKWARAGEEDIAASAIATIQLVGLALGAALAGLAANSTGLGEEVTRATAETAAFLVPSVFVAATAIAAWVAVRLVRLEKKPR